MSEQIRPIHDTYRRWVITRVSRLMVDDIIDSIIDNRIVHINLLLYCLWCGTRFIYAILILLGHIIAYITKILLNEKNHKEETTSEN